MASPTETRARARQAAALQAAESLVVEIRGKREGKSRTALAAEVGLSYDQYQRYVAGKAPLQYDQTEAFARLYGVDPDVLGQAILTGDTSAITAMAETPGWDMAAYLAPHIPADQIPEMVKRHRDETPEQQRFAADGYIRTTHRAQNRATRSRNHTA